MGAIVRIATTTPRAAAALIEVVAADDAIYAIDLGPNSGMREVVFQAPEVEIETGFVTLQGLMEDHAPGTGAEIVPVPLG